MTALANPLTGTPGAPTGRQDACLLIGSFGMCSRHAVISKLEELRSVAAGGEGLLDCHKKEIEQCLGAFGGASRPYLIDLEDATDVQLLEWTLDDLYQWTDTDFQVLERRKFLGAGGEENRPARDYLSALLSRYGG